jgi:hypothetical protein
MSLSKTLNLTPTARLRWFLKGVAGTTELSPAESGRPYVLWTDPELRKPPYLNTVTEIQQCFLGEDGTEHWCPLELFVPPDVAAQIVEIKREGTAS